jgi:hypothetical protein
MLRPQDLKAEISLQGNCYLNHRMRSEELDDILLDTANQIYLDKKDLKRWVTSSKSAEFLNTFHGLDIGAEDFLTELKISCDEGLISVPRYRGSYDRQEKGD